MSRFGGDQTLGNDIFGKSDADTSVNPAILFSPNSWTGQSAWDKKKRI